MIKKYWCFGSLDFYTFELVKCYCRLVHHCITFPYIVEMLHSYIKFCLFLKVASSWLFKAKLLIFFLLYIAELSFDQIWLHIPFNVILKRKWDALRGLVPFIQFKKQSKSNTPPRVSSSFLDCTNYTKSRKASQIMVCYIKTGLPLDIQVW